MLTAYYTSTCRIRRLLSTPQPATTRTLRIFGLRTYLLAAGRQAAAPSTSFVFVVLVLFDAAS